MRTARLIFVERIAKFTGIIPATANLVQSGYPNMYFVHDFEQGGIDYFKTLHVWVDKLKSGKYSIKIKQSGTKWEKGKLSELQEAFNPTKVQIKQRYYKKCGHSMNIINFYSDHLLW